jgi:hypothetical protein
VQTPRRQRLRWLWNPAGRNPSRSRPQPALPGHPACRDQHRHPKRCSRRSPLTAPSATSAVACQVCQVCQAKTVLMERQVKCPVLVEQTELTELTESGSTVMMVKTARPVAPRQPPRSTLPSPVLSPPLSRHHRDHQEHQAHQAHQEQLHKCLDPWVRKGYRGRRDNLEQIRKSPDLKGSRAYRGHLVLLATTWRRSSCTNARRLIKTCRSRFALWTNVR